MIFRKVNFLLSFLLVLCYTDAKKWEGNDYPSLLDESCNLEGSTEQKLVCDPDRILSKDQRLSLNKIALQILTETKCPCRDAGLCRGAPHGHVVALAVVEQLETKRKYSLQSGVERKLLCAQELASILLRRTWQLGRCGDATVVVYSYRDGVVFIYSGEVNRNTLTDGRVHKILHTSKTDFNGGKTPFSGLERVISGIRDAFKGEIVIMNG